MEEILHQFERNVPPMICKVYHVLYLLSISGGLGMGFHKTIQHLDNFFGTAGSWKTPWPQTPELNSEGPTDSQFQRGLTICQGTRTGVPLTSVPMVFFVFSKNFWG